MGIVEMALTSACVPKMATSRIFITTPSQSPNPLYIQNPLRDLGYLAGLSHHCGLLFLFQWLESYA